MLRFTVSLVLLALLTLLLGCGGTISSPGDTSIRDTAVTDSWGEASLYYADSGRSETISVRDSSSDDTLSGIEVLGLGDSVNSLYVAADPYYRHHPVITSGVSSSYYTNRIYLTPADLHSGANATSYHDISGDLLYSLVNDYGLPHSTTVADLRNQLSFLAEGAGAGLVVCLDEPLTSYSDLLAATEIAQRSNDLGSAFQAIGWQYIYTSRGFSSSQPLRLWTIDPYQLQITDQPGDAGALSNTFIAVVAPTTGSSGTVLPGALRVELTWDAPVDLDLHLTRNGAPIYDPLDDCFWKYLWQNWGDPYRTTDDPRLYFDTVSGYGPEKIVVDEMTPGDYYTVVVDYWGDPYEQITHTPVNATVKVWTENSSTPTILYVTGLTYGEPWHGDYKAVCDIEGSTGQVMLNVRTAVTRSTVRATGSKHQQQKQAVTQPVRRAAGRNAQ
ncbi:MAG: hypothetical protein ACYDBB_08150 [Armatimonadota bacterium]